MLHTASHFAFFGAVHGIFSGGADGHDGDGDDGGDLHGGGGRVRGSCLVGNEGGGDWCLVGGLGRLME